MRSKGYRWKEAGKSLLILLLTLSALWLLGKSPLVQSTGLSNLFEESLSSAAGEDSALALRSAAVSPSRMAVGGELGLYGVQYDRASTDALFDLAGPLLGEALAAARDPVEIPYAHWKRQLGGTCVYFDFTAPVPLSTLCAMLKEGGENGALTQFARHILLVQEADGSLTLCFYAEDEGEFISCRTGLDAELHLTPILAAVTANGAFFAFEDKTLPAAVADHTLFLDREYTPEVYTVTTPAMLTENSAVETLLDALSFVGQNRAEVSGGVLYVDGEDTLRFTGSGVVEYIASGAEKYPAAEGIAGAVEAAWALAEGALIPLCGEARLYLHSARQEEDGSYTVTFGYLLDGCVVELGGPGYAAQFRVSEGSVRGFTLHARTYTRSGQSKLLLPADKAAAALSALTEEEKELVIRYRDDGTTAEPGWSGR